MRAYVGKWVRLAWPKTNTEFCTREALGKDFNFCFDLITMPISIPLRIHARLNHKLAFSQMHDLLPVEFPIRGAASNPSCARSRTCGRHDGAEGLAKRNKKDSIHDLKTSQSEAERADDMPSPACRDEGRNFGGRTPKEAAGTSASFDGHVTCANRNGGTRESNSTLPSQPPRADASAVRVVDSVKK